MTLDNSKHRFFIAFMPPLEVHDYANKIKEYFAQNYNSQGSLNSPPHITLQPPFEWQLDSLSILEQAIITFANTQTSVPITLNGFGAFPDRVIYINVLKTPELLTLQQELMAYCEASLDIIDPLSKTRTFTPHLTVAFRDLTKQNFNMAWREFQHQQVEYNFIADQLTLLIHDGVQWKVQTNFPLLAPAS